jgi:hypothetical protein
LSVSRMRWAWVAGMDPPCTGFARMNVPSAVRQDLGV